MSVGRVAYVTGGTGLLGSHLVERLVADGWVVRALVREGTDASALAAQGVEVVRGDITQSAQALEPGMRGCSRVFHCAAFVDDWAPLAKMLEINVEGVRHVLKAAHAAGVARVVHIGSLAVYGNGDQVELDETSPFVETGDNYNHTKIACARTVREVARAAGLDVVTLVPPYIYGPRDRQFFPRVCATLRDGAWVYIDRGERPFTPVYVLHLVDACVRAAECAEAAGESFIITDGRSITRKRFVEILCEELGYAPPVKSVPRWLARTLVPVFEGFARLARAKRAPRLNTFRYKFLATHLTFDVSKARRVLGWSPACDTEDALRRTARWFRENRPELMPRQS
jgi:nucleoside-diphosphate-sugar epimerase